VADRERNKLTPAVSAHDHIVGPGDAAITLVQYGDYECPSCGGAYPIIKEIQQQLGSRLRFVFRNFPLVDAHPHALRAAEAAEAAAAQGRFWEMHDVLYEHQHALDDRHLVRYAAALGLDEGRFREELADRTHLPRIRDDVHSGERSGVRGTPTFFINGLRHAGPWDFDSLMEALGVSA
jgi:protein-disulfide isomerase